MDNVMLRVYGLAGAAEMEPIAFSVLRAGETKAITRDIRALEGSGGKVFNATLEIRADGQITTRDIRVSVEREGEGGDNPLAGLAVLFTDGGLLAGAIVLIALILLSLWLTSRKRRETEEMNYYVGT